VEVPIAVLADYANISQEGKVNVLGIFSEINPPVLPFVLPQMYLIVSFEAGAAEIGMQKHFRITLLEQDGTELLALESEAVVPQPLRPGAHAYMNQVIGLSGITFDRPGDYAFQILVGGEEKRAVPLRVNEPPTSIQGGPSA
jgi:hypothetical protein